MSNRCTEIDADLCLLDAESLNLLSTISFLVDIFTMLEVFSLDHHVFIKGKFNDSASKRHKSASISVHLFDTNFRLEI